MPYDLLSSLANALLDGTVYEIVRSLKEVQQLEERNLFQQRMNIVNEHKAIKKDLQRKQKEALQHCQMAKPHQLPYLQVQQERDFQTMEKKYEDELKRKDMKIILELDQKVMDQQVTLEKSGVPGFFVTNKPTEIKLQMHLLEFINRMSVMSMPL
ncbi:unnamed protein product [Owenia fusiformis]|nr:unnamed protein product [Owenia fusiformis]